MITTMQQQQQQQHTASSSQPPDTLADRLAYVEALVDMNALVLEAIWSSSSTSNNDIVPLRPFIHQVLKRSRTTYSTLQTAFFYLFRARPAILRQLAVHHHPDLAYIQCGRRMFLASLMVAAKFVQDKTYRNIAWANLAGLTVQEINRAERVFLELLGYRLYVAQATFDQWHTLLHAHVQAKSGTSSTSTSISSNSSSNSSSASGSDGSDDHGGGVTTTTTTTTQQDLFPSNNNNKIPSPSPLSKSKSSLSVSLSLPPPSATPGLSPSSTISSSACSSPTHLRSPSPPPQQQQNKNKRSLAHLLNSPEQQDPSSSSSSRKRPCLPSVSSMY